MSSFAASSAVPVVEPCANWVVPHTRPPRTFGRVLREIREAKGKAWTQKYVARLADLNHYTVHKAEKDKPQITHDTYARICRVLGTTLADVAAEVSPGVVLPEAVQVALGFVPPIRDAELQPSVYSVDTPAVRSETRTPEESEPARQLFGGTPTVDLDLDLILATWRHVPRSRRDAASSAVVAQLRRFIAEDRLKKALG
jgi:transcriptional regulator with XRE-family HTH domain